MHPKYKDMHAGLSKCVPNFKSEIIHHPPANVKLDRHPSTSETLKGVREPTFPSPFAGRSDPSLPLVPIIHQRNSERAFRPNADADRAIKIEHQRNSVWAEPQISHVWFSGQISYMLWASYSVGLLWNTFKFVWNDIKRFNRWLI